MGVKFLTLFMTLARVLCLVLVVVSLSCLSFSHTVKGTVSNDTNRTFSLTKALITHGKLSVNPTTILQPYASTGFQLDSSIFNDRIEFTWGYTATVDWCPDIPSQISGTYKYTFGANHCTGSNVVCPDYGNMTVIVESCAGAVGESNPVFYILEYFE